MGDGGPRARRARTLSHGFKVGLGSIAIAALYERLLERDLTAIDVDAVVSAWPTWDEVERDGAGRAHRPRGSTRPPSRETRAKYVDADALARPPRAAARALADPARAAAPSSSCRPTSCASGCAPPGCPTAPDEIGLSIEALKDTYRRARMIRRRYTVLDLAHEAGILEELVEELFAPGGFWAREAVSPA